MSLAHQRAARRLAALSSTERDWILSRLSSADALHIRELMEPGPAPAPAAPPPAPPAEIASTLPSAPPSAPQSILEQAAADDVWQLLQEEPDWFIALILAKRRWPWDREVLARLDAARFEALGMLAWRAREGAKPRACEAAIEVLAARLRELAPPPPAPSAFDELLAGVLAGERHAPGERA